MLDVYLFDRLVGQLTHGDAGISFCYNEMALGYPDRSQLSVRLAVRPEPYPHHLAAPFFENLLPEGDARELIAQAAKYDASDIQGLLGVVGGECAGAVSLWPDGMRPPAQPEYHPCSAAELDALLDEDDGTELTEAQVKGRQSMSGVQPKLVLRRRGGVYELPKGGAPTNVMLKRARRRHPGIVHNELASLQCMRAAGVPVVDATAPAGFNGFFETTRYDRLVHNDGIDRLHQEDFCQATGKSPRAKYQETGGPALADLTAVLVRYSVSAIEDLDVLARWMVANLCIGNNDAHAKNLSLLYGQTGIRLAPVYDVVCTLAYPQIDQRLSISLGGAYDIAELSPQVYRKAARALGMSHTRLHAVADEVIQGIEGALDAICHDMATRYGDVPVIAQVREIVRARVAALKRV